MESLEFSTCKSCHLQIVTVLLLPVQFGCLFIICVAEASTGCLFALAMTLNSMLDKSYESRHPCLVLDLGGIAFNFHH